MLNPKIELAINIFAYSMAFIMMLCMFIIMGIDMLDFWLPQ